MRRQTTTAHSPESKADYHNLQLEKRIILVSKPSLPPQLFAPADKPVQQKIAPPYTVTRHANMIVRVSKKKCEMQLDRIRTYVEHSVKNKIRTYIT